MLPLVNRVSFLDTGILFGIILSLIILGLILLIKRHTGFNFSRKGFPTKPFLLVVFILLWALPNPITVLIGIIGTAVMVVLMRRERFDKKPSQNRFVKAWRAFKGEDDQADQTPDTKSTKAASKPVNTIAQVIEELVLDAGASQKVAKKTVDKFTELFSNLDDGAKSTIEGLLPQEPETVEEEIQTIVFLRMFLSSDGDITKTTATTEQVTEMINPNNQLGILKACQNELKKEAEKIK